MKITTGIILVGIMLTSCGSEIKKDLPAKIQNPITGTWQLITGTLIEKGDTTVTHYDKKRRAFALLFFLRMP